MERDPAGGLRRIVVRGLFGSRDHDIAVDVHRPTVLTGGNGTGKSTLLRLVNAVSSADISTLVRAPLSAFELHFDSMSPFILSRNPAKSSVTLSWGDHDLESVGLASEFDDLPAWAHDTVLDASLRDEDRREALKDIAQAEGISFSEFAPVRDLLERSDFSDRYSAPPDWMAELRSRFPVLFVTDQRLLVDTQKRATRPGGRRRTSRLAVEEASAEIALNMRRVDSTYARVSQNQDRRFPRDVIDAMAQPGEIAIPDLELLIQQVDERRAALRAVGILDVDQEHEPDLARESLEQQHVRPVIATFLQSSLAKLAVLEDLSVKLRTFKRFLDGRFKGKSLELDRHAGVRFRLEGGIAIRPSQLSSGEQQMMLLAYEVLFRARKGTLLIVDEPEISLHVLWQDTLLDDLAEMAAPRGVQFLMASHSPILLASNPDLERSLDVARVPAA